MKARGKREALRVARGGHARSEAQRVAPWWPKREAKSAHSAEGAKYESQGQARSEAKRVAPGGHKRKR
jgi:hypothetical protein